MFGGQARAANRSIVLIGSHLRACPPVRPRDIDVDRGRAGARLPVNAGEESMEKIAILLALGTGSLNPGTEQARPAQTAPAQPAAPAQDAGPAWQLICPPAP